jgi:molybdate transport system substrate-binding protein
MAELKLIATNAVRSVLDELVPPFERQSGHKVSISYTATAQTLERIKGGETTDLVIATAAGIDELTALGKVVRGSRVDLASSMIGVAVRAGAPKPDIRTIDAFKRALLDAKAIAYTAAGLSGIYFSKLIERLGIANEIKAKARIKPGGLIAEVVVAGEADLAVQMVSELLSVPGAELVGPLPEEINQVSIVAAGVFAGTSQSEAAQSLIHFLTTPPAAHVMRDKGLTPAREQ